MREIMSLIKTVYNRNRLLAVVLVLVAIVLIAGCSAQGGAPPQGPIGGGCG